MAVDWDAAELCLDLLLVSALMQAHCAVMIGLESIAELGV